MLKRHARIMATPLRRDLEAKLFRGLGDATRLSLLRALSGGPETAGALARELQISPSNASNHLRCLLECGLVSVTFESRFAVYAQAPAIPRLFAAAEDVLSTASPAIEACLNYGPPSRRTLRNGARIKGSAQRQGVIASRPRSPKGTGRRPFGRRPHRRPSRAPRGSSAR